MAGCPAITEHLWYGLAERGKGETKGMAGGEGGVTLGQPHLSRQDLATLVGPGFAAGAAQ